jgi:hypothetical protein
MLAVEARASRQTVLFGLGLLFEALNDPPRAKKLKELCDFDAFRYRELTAACEIFSDYQLLDESRRAGAMLEGLQRQVQEAEERGAGLQNHLDEIETSAGWRSLQAVRRVRLWLVSPGGARERIWYALLSRARARGRH